jgi:glycosyltransferase involved in cell wall biosynthesis
MISPLNFTTNTIAVSVVVPLYNEEATIPELYTRLTNAMQAITNSYELIWVNDGSADDTLGQMKKYAAQDAHIKYISFSRNFGHQSAISAGIENAVGNAVVIIDGDLQDPPEVIADLYAKFNQGYHVVYAKRAKRDGETWFKTFTAKTFYRVLKNITSIDIPVDTGDFRIISKEIKQHLTAMDEKNKFIRGQIAWLGYKQTYIEYDRRERQQGETKFTVRKMMRFALDGITSFSNFPLQIATFLGFFFSVIAFLVILYALYSKFILHEVVNGWTSIMVATMFLGGVQLLCVGIIGEYISRIANDVKKRPSFIIEENNLERK